MQHSDDVSTYEERSEALSGLVEQMIDVHPNLFHGISEGDFVERQLALDEQLDDLTDDQFAVGLMRLVELLYYG